MAELLSPDDLAAELKIPVRTIYRWNHEGTGPTPIKVGKHVRYTRESVDAFLTAHTAEREPVA